MYYSAGNYEAFAHPKKVEGAERKKAYIVGSGLAGLTTAFYLVRDAGVPGENVFIFDRDPVSGGACDGAHDPKYGYYMRGGREMDNHFEVMWDVYRDVPSKDNPNVSVLDEYYWLNKEDPNYSLCRATDQCGHKLPTGHDFTLDKEAQTQLLKLFLTPEKELEYKKISDCFDEHFWRSNFWLYWQTMFAFQEWSSALEMKRYLQRYVHHIDGLPDFTALRFTRYNQYESMILPLLHYLEKRGVSFIPHSEVTNVIVKECPNGKKRAQSIEVVISGEKKTIDLGTDDYVFVTNGSCVDSSCYGSQNKAPDLSLLQPGRGDSFDLWKAMARQVKDHSFGHPEAFCSNIEETNWMSATIDVDETLIPYITKITQRDPRTGKVCTGGIVTVKDSWDYWRCSWTINRQGQFEDQPKDRVLVWFYSLYTNRPGNYIKKPMRECTGMEVAEEWMYHIGVPTDKIEEYAKKHANTTTAFMPYIDAFFQPRSGTDRPLVVPKGSENIAFIGQFAEIPADTIFTTEYSMRSGMEAVYTLLNVDRGVPEVWGSRYDVRELLRATYYSVDRKQLKDMPLSCMERFLLKKVLKKVRDTDIETLLRESKLL